MDIPQSSRFRVSFPAKHVILVTLTRPEKLNCVDKATSKEIEKAWQLLDHNEDLWIGIITGSGRAFCTGADLQEWHQMNKAGVVNDMSAPGLAGLPRRAGKKPIIAAINGICMGGGFEMMVNCDLIVASEAASFALSEVKRGIVPVAGGLPRLTRTIGLQRTNDLVLTGRTVGAHTLHDWGLINRVVAPQASVVDAAVALAQELCNNSPDALIVGRAGVRTAWHMGDVEAETTMVAEQWYPRLVSGSNFSEGIEAFVQKRRPRWTNSKL